MVCFTRHYVYLAANSRGSFICFFHKDKGGFEMSEKCTLVSVGCLLKLAFC